jgi:hypothetical protein
MHFSRSEAVLSSGVPRAERRAGLNMRGVYAASMLPLSLQEIRSGGDEPGDSANDERATLLSL